jgi:hypothetical protein
MNEGSPFGSIAGWRITEITENASLKLLQLRRHWLNKDTVMAFTPSSAFLCTDKAFKAADTPSLLCPFKRNANA